MNRDDYLLLNWLTDDAILGEENKNGHINEEKKLRNAKENFAVKNGEWYNKTDKIQFITVKGSQVPIKPGQNISEAVSKSEYNFIVPQVLRKINKILNIYRTHNYITKDGDIIKISLWGDTIDFQHITNRLLELKEEKYGRKANKNRETPQIEDFYNSIKNPEKIEYNEKKDSFYFIYETCMTSVCKNGQIKTVYPVKKKMV